MSIDDESQCYSNAELRNCTPESLREFLEPDVCLSCTRHRLPGTGKYKQLSDVAISERVGYGRNVSRSEWNLRRYKERSGKYSPIQPQYSGRIYRGSLNLYPGQTSIEFNKYTKQ